MRFQVLPDSIKDNDGVIHGKAHDGQKTHYEKSVNFGAGVFAQNSKEAGWNSHIVNQGQNRNHSILPGRNRPGNASENKGDKNNDGQNN